MHAPKLTLEGLRTACEEGSIDTIIVAFPDMQGRMQGKRLHPQFFFDSVLNDGTEGCNYLLATDVEMNTVDGYAISSWERGYGDMEFELDMTTLRRTPGDPRSATIMCNLAWLDGSGLVAQAPRSVLRTQQDVAKDMGFSAFAGTELEFILFDDTYDEAWEARYQNLTPANRYNVDYSLLGGAKVEPLLREIRNEMYASGAIVESAKGECNYGQHEIVFRYEEVHLTCDTHTIYKTAAKQISEQHGKALTFMAKYDQREGNSCHIHMSLRDANDKPVFGQGPDEEPRDGGRTETFEHFMAGVLATMGDFTLLYAPNINSYKRFAPGSFAPTAIAWGTDNRTCALRVVGHGAGMRVENRVPGGDVNPYLATAAMLAGGLYGIREKLELEPALEGSAYDSDAEHVPNTLQKARDRFAASTLARELLGDEVVEHYLRAADVELEAFGKAVTDWERIRGFERL